MRVMKYVYNALNDKFHVMGGFKELTKAFDILNYDISLAKLKSYGIRGPVAVLTNNAHNQLLLCELFVTAERLNKHKSQ